MALEINEFKELQFLNSQKKFKLLTTFFVVLVFLLFSKGFCLQQFTVNDQHGLMVTFYH